MTSDIDLLWPQTAKEAIALQNRLRERVSIRDDFTAVSTVAGIDVGVKRGSNVGKAAIVVLSLPDLNQVDSASVEQSLDFPYIPGLLSFREIPIILLALEKLTTIPDLLLCDGQGIAHPRRLGIASHLGLITEIPSIGVAKTRLTGKHGPVPEGRGEWTPLLDKKEVIGAVLRTRAGVSPVYVSPGHKISLSSAIDFTMRCTTRYRLPQTTRLAHKLSQFNRA